MATVERVRSVSEGDEIKLLVGPSHDRQWWITAALAPCESQHGGHWFCLTHNEGFQNQLQKDGHINRGDHELVWMCHEHGPEAP